MMRFLKIEIPAVIVLIASAVCGFLRPFPNPGVILIVNAVTIAAACVVAITPIVFFAATPTLPQADR
jgi:hypothetical protein